MENTKCTIYTYAYKNDRRKHCVYLYFTIANEMTEQEQKEIKHLEFASLVWLDKDVHEQQKEQVSTTNNATTIPTRQQLRSIINYLKVFDQLDACENYIQNVDTQERIVLIASGSYCKEILPRIHCLKQLYSAYIYCMNEQEHENWTKQFPKVSKQKCSF